jgi:murein DD-endopeptidase MepM/ murein hydrolase activator NlpD
MPSGCSNRRLAALGLALLIGPATIPPVQAANERWRLGVFPVVNFAGYTSHFGFRIGPGGGREQHSGLDIAAPLGSPIRSWWGGVVSDVINDGRCGIGLVIRSGDYDHIYCHLGGQVSGGRYQSGRVLLAAGQRVARGQLIGHIGMTGRTTGPHLHWGIRYRGQWLDPARILQAMVRSRRSFGGGAPGR